MHPPLRRVHTLQDVVLLLLLSLLSQLPPSQVVVRFLLLLLLFHFGSVVFVFVVGNTGTNTVLIPSRH